MKLCTTKVVNGLDNKPHYAIVALGQPGWPLLLGGLADGAMDKESKAEVEFFARAPVMNDMLEQLADLLKGVSPDGIVKGEKLESLCALACRAAALVKKNREKGLEILKGTDAVVTMNDRYADADNFDPSEFDAIEIHGVRDYNPPDDPNGTCCEVCDDDPQFFSVYGHCKAGGVVCLGDHGTYLLAMSYAVELSGKYTWPIHDHVSRKFRSLLNV